MQTLAMAMNLCGDEMLLKEAKMGPLIKEILPLCTQNEADPSFHRGVDSYKW